MYIEKGRHFVRKVVYVYNNFFSIKNGKVVPLVGNVNSVVYYFLI